MSKTAHDKPALPVIPPEAPVTFEAALAELETIAEEMESGRLGLEESLAAYQRGIALLEHCRSALGAAEQKIQVLEAGQLRNLADTPE